MQKSMPIILAACLLSLGLIAGCSGKHSELVAAGAPSSPRLELATQDLLKTKAAPIDVDKAKAEVTAPKPIADILSRTRVLSEYQFSIVGLGIDRERVPGGIRVAATALGSGAAKAGIRPGDIIVSIDGVSIGSLQPAEVDNLLTGSVGQERSLETTNGQTLKATVGPLEMKNLGPIRAFDEESFAMPSMEGIHAELKPVLQLVVDRKYRAAERILETLAGPHATDGSYYLIRALNQAAAHGMLTSDSRAVDESSGKTLTAQILEDVDLAVEMDETLEGVAAELLAWLSTRIVRDAAKVQVELTWVTPSDHLRWNMETENRYRAIGDWIQLLNKSESLSSKVMPRYLDAIAVSRDMYLTKQDIRSAAFLDGVLAYRYSLVDGGSEQMLHQRTLAVKRSAIRLMTRYLRENPGSAMEVAAVFNAMCAEGVSDVSRPGEPEFDEFWKLLTETDIAAATFAIRYYHLHQPPQFNRLASPMEAYLFHIESFFNLSIPGLKASTQSKVFESLQDLQEFVDVCESNMMVQSMLPMKALMSGLVPEFITNAATHAPFVATNEHGVDFYLITMKLNETQFDREVTMMVPMMAQAKLQPLKAVIEEIVPEQTLAETLSRAVDSGRAEDLVVGIVYKTTPDQFQVLSSPVINLLTEEQ